MSNYVYRAAAGQTFDSVAAEVYGDENCAAEILCANPEYADRLTFTGVETLYLPVVERIATPEIPDTAPWKSEV